MHHFFPTIQKSEPIDKLIREGDVIDIFHTSEYKGNQLENFQLYGKEVTAKNNIFLDDI